MNETHKSDKAEKHTHKSEKKDNKLPLVVLLVVLLLMGLVVLLNSNSNSNKNESSTKSPSPTSSVTGSGIANLYVAPADKQVSAGNPVTLEVWVDSGSDPVNAVQANLVYPADKFDFKSIDAKGSAFEVQALSTGGNGKVNIARGHIGELKGRSLVAKVTLIAKTDTGDATLNFADGSAVIRTTDHKNILKDKTGSTIKVSRAAVRKTEA
jgi:hypothetical protein